MNPYDLPQSAVPIDQLVHEGITLSRCFKVDGDGIYVIDDPAIFSTPFSYKRYCQKQNEWMRQYKTVYRYIAGDQGPDWFPGDQVTEWQADYQLTRTMDRENVLADPSPLEFRFEEIFAETFGQEALKYLKREYSLLTDKGSTAYVDYALFRKDGSWVAIDENGVSFHHPFHHPFLIKDTRYRQILNKQNSIMSVNGTVFRWDTESLANRERIMDELKEFLGDLDDYIVQYSLTSPRGFSLHTHQEDCLKELARDRALGRQAALVVLPTGERVIIVMGAINAIVSRVLGTFIKYNSCIA